MMLLLTLRGTPTLYYGDELGLPDAVVPADRARDPWGLRVEGLSRDPSRAPMPWNHVPSAGFCPDGVEPWLPFAADPREFSVQAQNRQDDSMLSFTKRLLALRRAKPALHRGEQTVLDAYGQDVLLLSRRHGAEEVIVAISFSEVGGTVDLAKAGCEYPRAWSALLSTSAGAATVDEGMLTLAGNSGVILGAA
jgi:alpha-glucosidase